MLATPNIPVKNLLPAISRLHEDILIDIFEWNATLDSDSAPLLGTKLDEQKYKSNALYYARSASQVSRTWRDAAIGSASVWGKILNLGFLKQGNSFWREEVLRRTGEAPLELRAQLFFNDSMKDDAVLPFLISILNKDWKRIVKIQLAIDDEEGHALHKIFQNLQKRTSTMLSFDFRLGVSSLEHDISGPLENLFADNAPFLLHFSATEIKIPLNTSWITGLRSLHISYNKYCHEANRPTPYSVEETLAAIGRMSLLEDLRLHRAFTTETPAPLPNPIILPHLRSLHLMDDCRSCLAFLSSIEVPHMNWKININLFASTVGQYPEGAWDLMGDIMFKHLQQYLEVHSISSIELRIDDVGLQLIHTPCPTSSLPGFVFSISDISPRDYKAFLPQLLSKLSSFRINEVKSFTLEFGRRNLFPLSEKGFADLLTALASVEILRTKISVLYNLLELRPLLKSCFPSLKILEMDYPDNPSIYTANQSTLPFLSWRTETGLLQIKMLKLGSVSSWTDTIVSDAVCLDRLKGLKVTWYEPPSEVIHEYSCGSGNAHRLTFDWFEDVLPELTEEEREDEGDLSESEIIGTEMLFPY